MPRDDMAVVLLSRDSLLREGLKSVLVDANFNVVHTGVHVDDSFEDVAGKLDRAIVVWLGGGFDGISALQSIKQRHSNFLVAVVGDADDPEVLGNALMAGIDAVMAMTVAPLALVQSLRLLVLGEGVVQARAALSLLQRKGREPGVRPSATALDNLTKSECVILKHLTAGLPNKLIARELNISESTVKVHIRNLMIKLGVSNRTQAALLAMGKAVTNGPSFSQAVRPPARPEGFQPSVH